MKPIMLAEHSEKRKYIASIDNVCVYVFNMRVTDHVVLSLTAVSDSESDPQSRLVCGG